MINTLNIKSVPMLSAVCHSLYITATMLLLLLLCFHFQCCINKYCFVRAYMLSFVHSFPTYPCAIRTVVTAVVYMALQTECFLSLQYSYYYRWNVRHRQEARTLTTRYRGPWRARALCALWRDVLIPSRIPRAPNSLFGVSSRAICPRPVWSEAGPVRIG